MESGTAEVISLSSIFGLTESFISIDFLELTVLSLGLFLIVADSFSVALLVVSVSFLETSAFSDSEVSFEGPVFLVCTGFFGLYFVVSKFFSPKAL